MQCFQVKSHFKEKKCTFRLILFTKALHIVSDRSFHFAHYTRQRVQRYDKNTTAILRKCTRHKQVKGELSISSLCYAVERGIDGLLKEPQCGRIVICVVYSIGSFFCITDIPFSYLQTVLAVGQGIY